MQSKGFQVLSAIQNSGPREEVGSSWKRHRLIRTHLQGRVLEIKCDPCEKWNEHRVEDNCLLRHKTLIIIVRRVFSDTELEVLTFFFFSQCGSQNMLGPVTACVLPLLWPGSSTGWSISSLFLMQSFTLLIAYRQHTQALYYRIAKIGLRFYGCCGQHYFMSIKFQENYSS